MLSMWRSLSSSVHEYRTLTMWTFASRKDGVSMPECKWKRKRRRLIQCRSEAATLSKRCGCKAAAPCEVELAVLRTFPVYHTLKIELFLTYVFFLGRGGRGGQNLQHRCISILSNAGGHARILYIPVSSQQLVYMGWGDNRCLLHPAGMHRFCKSPQQYGLGSRLVTAGVCRTRRACTDSVNLRNSLYICDGVPSGDNRCLPHPAGIHRLVKCCPVSTLCWNCRLGCWHNG